MYYYLIRAIDNRNKLLCWDIGLLTIFLCKYRRMEINYLQF